MASMKMRMRSCANQAAFSHANCRSRSEERFNPRGRIPGISFRLERQSIDWESERKSVNELAVVVFLAGTGFTFYIVAGYPLLLAVMARWRPKPIRKRFTDTPVTVLLAVYNGENWIRAKLESIGRLDYPRPHMQILVISDGSTDQTESIVTEFQAEGVELLRVPHGGKAAALNAGM